MYCIWPGNFLYLTLVCFMITVSNLLVICWLCYFQLMLNQLWIEYVPRYICCFVLHIKDNIFIVLLGDMVSHPDQQVYRVMTPWSYCSRSWLIIRLCLLYWWRPGLVIFKWAESYRHSPTPWPCFRDSLCCNQVYCCPRWHEDHFSTLLF